MHQFLLPSIHALNFLLVAFQQTSVFGSFWYLIA